MLPSVFLADFCASLAGSPTPPAEGGGSAAGAEQAIEPLHCILSTRFAPPAARRPSQGQESPPFSPACGAEDWAQWLSPTPEEQRCLQELVSVLQDEAGAWPAESAAKERPRTPAKGRRGQFYSAENKKEFRLLCSRFFVKSKRVGKKRGRGGRQADWARAAPQGARVRTRAQN